MTTQLDGGDLIDRALGRQGVAPGSPMERLVRLNAYRVLVGDPGGWDSALDTFIGEHREDDFYAASFTAPPRQAAKVTISPNEQELRALAASGKISSAPPSRATKKPPIDTMNPTPQEFADIASGKVAVE